MKIRIIYCCMIRMTVCVLFVVLYDSVWQSSSFIVKDWRGTLHWSTG